MKVFVSWSGERSQLFAQALHDWLPMVLQSVTPWLSHADISAGDRWADTVAKELETSDFGITCITRENMSSPWIHFEAGALAKRMKEGHVIPLLLDIDFKDIFGPLAQFQAKKADRDGLMAVVSAINNLSDVKVSDTLLPKQFDALWPALENKINDIPKNQSTTRQQRPQHEVLEDLVSSVRGLDIKVRETVDDIPRFSKRGRRFHPMMMMELSHFSRKSFAGGAEGSLEIMMLLSVFKEDLPWLYDLAVDAYQQTSRQSPYAAKARQRVLEALKMLRRGPWLEMFDNKEAHFVLHEIENFTRSFLEFSEAAPNASPSKDRPVKPKIVSRKSDGDI